MPISSLSSHCFQLQRAQFVRSFPSQHRCHRQGHWRGAGLVQRTRALPAGGILRFQRDHAPHSPLQHGARQRAAWAGARCAPGRHERAGAPSRQGWTGGKRAAGVSRQERSRRQRVAGARARLQRGGKSHGRPAWTRNCYRRRARSVQVLLLLLLLLEVRPGREDCRVVATRMRSC